MYTLYIIIRLSYVVFEVRPLPRLLYSYKSIPRFGRFYTSDLARLSTSGLFKTLESMLIYEPHTHTYAGKVTIIMSDSLSTLTTVLVNVVW